MIRTKKRLVLADRLAFVVKDSPAAADPADVRRGIYGCYISSVVLHLDQAGLRLSLFLNLATEAVGVTETDLDFETARRDRITGVCLAG